MDLNNKPRIWYYLGKWWCGYYDLYEVSYLSRPIKVWDITKCGQGESPEEAWNWYNSIQKQKALSKVDSLYLKEYDKLVNNKSFYQQVKDYIGGYFK